MANNVVKVSNPNLPPPDSDPSTNNDILFHLGLSRQTHDLPALFGDVKFVITGGTASRMRQFIGYITKELKLSAPENDEFVDYSGHAGRYALFKNGPVIAVSHGIGFASLSIVINEIIKLLYYAHASDVRLFRLGTCGGIGVQPGTVIVTNRCIDGLYRTAYEQTILGRLVKREATIDTAMADDVKACSLPGDGFEVRTGTTMSAGDFYEGQGRLDGVFCDYTETDKLSYLKNLHENGVLNIEMESVLLASVCHHANIKFGVVCVALINRLQGDQVTSHNHAELDKHPQIILARFIKKTLL